MIGEKPGETVGALGAPKESPPDAAREVPTRSKRAVLIFLVTLAVFNLNGRAITSYDSLAASIIPFHLWHGEGFSLDAWAEKVPRKIGYSMAQGRNGHWYPVYPVAVSVLVTPLYVPTVVFPRFRPETPGVGGQVRQTMEKLSASVVAALSAAVLFLALAEITSPGVAILLALTYAFATPTWTISSQGLWQQGPTELLLAAALFMLVRGRPTGVGSGFTLGLLAGLLTAVRPQALVYSAAIAAIALRRTGWRRLWPFAVGASLIAVLLVSFNLWTFGNVLGGYVHAPFPGGAKDIAPAHFSFAHLAGLLLSNRGLLVFCPFFFVLLVRWRWPRRLTRSEVLVLVGAWSANVLMMSSYDFWFAGYCYGPRYLTDGLPFLVLLLAAPLESLRGVLGRVVFGAAVIFAVMIQAVGAACFPGGNSGRMAGLWDALRSEPVMAALAGPRSPTLLPQPIPGVSMNRPLRGPDARAALSWVGTPERRWRAGTVHLLRVRIGNRSGRFWSSIGGPGGRDAVLVSLVVRSPAEPVKLEHPSVARWLALRLAPGESTDRLLWVLAPNRPGPYVVQVQLGQSAMNHLNPLPEDAAPPLRLTVEVVG